MKLRRAYASTRKPLSTSRKFGAGQHTLIVDPGCSHGEDPSCWMADWLADDDGAVEPAQAEAANAKAERASTT